MTNPHCATPPETPDPLPSRRRVRGVVEQAAGVDSGPDLPLTEVEIRQALLARLRAIHAGDPDCLVIEELGLCAGDARVDIAVVNGSLAGFEIKSDHDTLTRLPRQRRHYGRVLDTVTLVVGSEHLGEARRRIPKWWGVLQASRDRSPRGDGTSSGEQGGILLELIRPAAVNPRPDAYSLAQLLWRDEGLRVLRDHDLHHGLSRSPRRLVWRRLSSALPYDVLARAVRDAIRARAATWRAGSRST